MRTKLMLVLLMLMPPLVQAASEEVAIITQDVELIETILKPTSALKLRSSIALIYDEKGKLPLYSKNANAIVPIASITKLMTAMVVLDAQLPMDEKITINILDVDTLKGTHSRVRPGMRFSRAELMKLSLI